MYGLLGVYQQCTCHERHTQTRTNTQTHSWTSAHGNRRGRRVAYLLPLRHRIHGHLVPPPRHLLGACPPVCMRVHNSRHVQYPWPGIMSVSALRLGGGHENVRAVRCTDAQSRRRRGHPQMDTHRWHAGARARMLMYCASAYDLSHEPPPHSRRPRQQQRPRSPRRTPHRSLLPCDTCADEARAHAR